MTEPAVSAILGHLDTTVVLSRDQARRGIVWIRGLPSAAMDDLLLPGDGSRAVEFHLSAAAASPAAAGSRGR
ncbi:MAG: hypothetical protein M3Z21_12535 [Pseudomonadota bacterium]|nr:hypothetical protein [Pseudomonadota bacterium]